MGGLALPLGGGASEYSKALADPGISTQTASRYQALANVPQPVFEESLQDPPPPSLTRWVFVARLYGGSIARDEFCQETEPR